MPYWEGKICVVTGGSAGLGLAIAMALAERGAKVIPRARNVERLESAAQSLRRLGGLVSPMAADVAWQEDVDRLAAKIGDQFGRVDFLCNCAGRSARGGILETTPEDFQQLLDVNFLAVVRTTRALAPLLLASRGHLVNIGSLASKTAACCLGAYPASKFALAAYTQQLRLELSAHGLHVMLVCPGPIARPDGGIRYASEAPDIPAAAQSPGAGTKLPSLDPGRVAHAILAACQRRRPELVIPRKAKVLFTLSQISASWGDWLLRKAMRG
ncbi:MAG: SDR family NAD(P)-dependent oxidoreductase [Pirellulales bacterium]|nr:SDR family NAD(P)-dependent oxidoreductase [Pirellulales bacterium]